MRRTKLLTQVILVNLLLIGGAVLAAALASNPDVDLADTGATGLVLGFALAATIVANLFLLSRRFEPLQRLTDEMERASLSRSATAVPEEIASSAPEEVRRLELAFRRMIERLESERRRGAHAALQAQERERTRVARDLHDEVNQALTALVLRIEALRTKAPPELSEQLAETRAVASQAMEELLALARQLRPTALDDLGLKAALAGLVEEIGRQSEIETAFESEDSVAGLPDDIQLVTYRVAQEALSNAVRHAGASHIRVRLLRPDGGLELRITDDGSGFSFEQAGTGLGLTGMRERALLVGGRLEIESRPQLGTRVRLRVSAEQMQRAG